LEIPDYLQAIEELETLKSEVELALRHDGWLGIKASLEQVSALTIALDCLRKEKRFGKD
jgi:hypothetical protein